MDAKSGKIYWRYPVGERAMLHGDGSKPLGCRNGTALSRPAIKASNPLMAAHASAASYYVVQGFVEMVQEETQTLPDAFESRNCMTSLQTGRAITTFNCSSKVIHKDSSNKPPIRKVKPKSWILHTGSDFLTLDLRCAYQKIEY